jgi:Utp11 protein
VQDRGNASLPVDMVKILKTQDENYVRTMRAAGLKVRHVCYLSPNAASYSVIIYRKLRNLEIASRNSLSPRASLLVYAKTMTPALMRKNLRSSGRQVLLRDRPRLGVSEDHHDLRRNTLFSLRMRRKVCMDDLLARAYTLIPCSKTIHKETDRRFPDTLP